MDLENVCRVCRCSDQEMFLIFDKKYGEDDVSIATMLSTVTIYKVERYDDLPHLICGPCMNTAKIAFRFKRKCEHSYRQLVKLSGKNYGLLSRSRVTKNIKYEDKGMQTNETTMYPCERCDEKFFTFEGLKAHKDSMHKESGIRCRFCQKTFNSIEYLKTHIAVFHPEAGHTSHNQCYICERQFTRREHMRRHLAVIHKIVEVINNDSQIESGDTTNNDEITSETLQVDPSEKSESLELSSVVPIKVEDNGFADVQACQTESEEELSHCTNNNICMENMDNHQEDTEDEYEKPLWNLIESDNISKGFLKVLLDECGVNKVSEDMEKLDEEMVDNCATQPEDVLITRKRRRSSRTTKEKSTSGDHHGYQCHNCDKTFQHRSTFQKHLLAHTKEKERSCLICSKRCANTTHLKQHMRKVHNSSKVIKCNECSKLFTHATQLKRHMDVQHFEKMHQCTLCEKTFTTKVYMKRHIETHDKKRFNCKECAQSYLTKKELSAHSKAEGHGRPMLCPECGLRCKTKNILMVHMRRHTGEKPYKCRFCSKGFPRRDDLRVHEKYHTNEKSHFCETCGKGFQRKYNLTIHLRVHTGERPYKCPHCPQAFTQGNDLKAHIRRHTGERFRCEFCSAAFVQGYQIRQHKLSQHGIKDVPPTQRVAKFTSPEEQDQQIKQIIQKELAKDTMPSSTALPPNEDQIW